MSDDAVTTIALVALILGLAICATAIIVAWIRNN